MLFYAPHIPWIDCFIISQTDVCVHTYVGIRILWPPLLIWHILMREEISDLFLRNVCLFLADTHLTHSNDTLQSNVYEIAKLLINP